MSGHIPSVKAIADKVEQVEWTLKHASQMKTDWGPTQIQLYIQRPGKTTIVHLEVMQKNPYADLHVLFDNEHLEIIVEMIVLDPFQDITIMHSNATYTKSPCGITTTIQTRSANTSDEQACQTMRLG